MLNNFSISGCCDRVQSDCCKKVSVEYTEKNEAYERQHVFGIYTSYVIEKGMINGRNHYTSEDGTRAITYTSCSNKWYIQSDQDRYVVRSKNLR